MYNTVTTHEDVAVDRVEMMLRIVNQRGNELIRIRFHGCEPDVLQRDRRGLRRWWRTDRARRRTVRIGTPTAGRRILR